MVLDIKAIYYENELKQREETIRRQAELIAQQAEQIKQLEAEIEQLKRLLTGKAESKTAKMPRFT
jgi:cell shape-determining protein MreC